MIDALVTGKLIRPPELKTGQSGKPYCQFLLSVYPQNETEPILVSGIAFTEQAQRIAKLGKGDPLAVIGGLKPTQWTEKVTGEPKHGLSVTVSETLSPYDIKKRRPPAAQTINPEPFNDAISF